MCASLSCRLEASKAPLAKLRKQIAQATQAALSEFLGESAGAASASAGAAGGSESKAEFAGAAGAAAGAGAAPKTAAEADKSLPSLYAALDSECAALQAALWAAMGRLLRSSEAIEVRVMARFRLFRYRGSAVLGSHLACSVSNCWQACLAALLAALEPLADRDDFQLPPASKDLYTKGFNDKVEVRAAVTAC